jgi:hypothetical protein
MASSSSHVLTVHIFKFPFLLGLRTTIFRPGLPTKNVRMFQSSLRLILLDLIVLKYGVKQNYEALPWTNNYISTQKQKLINVVCYY